MALGLSLPGSAAAAVFSVNTTADAPDAAPGNGVCATSGGFCTLRAAIQENGAPPNGQDTITLPAGDYQLNDFAGALTVTDDIRLEGAGAATTVIHPTSSATLFHVDPAAEAQIRDVTLQGGNGTEGGAIHNEGGLVVFGSVLRDNTGTDGGAIYSEGSNLAVINSTIGGPTSADANIAGFGGDGGGIYVDNAASGIVTVQGSTIRGNRVDSPSTEASGGGIDVSSPSVELRVTDSEVSHNVAHTTASGVGSEGGGIATVGELTMTRTRVEQNSATSVGGLNVGGGLAVRGDATITDSTLFANFSEGIGGGLLVGSGPSPAVTAVTGSTLFGNQANGPGPGAWVGDALVVTNSTFTTNFGLTNASTGGAAHVAPGGSLALTDSTLAGNAATEGDAIYTEAPPSGFLPPVSLRATILELTGGTLCAKAPGAAGFFSLDYNVARDSSCSLTMPSDRQGVDPQLMPLADNGGPTQTHELAAGSPAVDLVTAGCPPPAADQRGVVRPQRAACDAGSFELEPDLEPEPPDVKLILEAAAKRKQRLRKLKARVECPEEPCEATVSGAVKAKPAASGDKSAKPTRFKLKPKAASLAAGERARIRVKPPRGARRKLATLLETGHRVKAKLAVDATDAAGNHAQEKLRVRLKP